MEQGMTWEFTGTDRKIVCGFTVLITLVLCVALMRTLPAEPETSEEGAPLHIHMIGASSEYNAKDTLMLLKQRLTDSYNVNVTMTRGPGEAKQLEGLGSLKDADLLVLYARRLELNEDDWSHIQAYLNTSRPIVGIRTASHAFDKNFPDFDQQILGASYEGHMGDKPVQVNVVEKHSNHPILDGITSWKRKWGDLYDNVELADSTSVLLTGDDGRRTMPVAWTNEVDDRRVFYTSMGMPEDFREDRQFMKLLLNGIHWSLHGTLSSRSANDSGTPRTEKK